MIIIQIMLFSMKLAREAILRLHGGSLTANLPTLFEFLGLQIRRSLSEN